jgi:xanthine dehydrogenase accessory factor
VDALRSRWPYEAWHNLYKESVAVARNIFQAALKMLEGRGNAALVTIVSAEGFVPVSATSKLLVTSTGILMGRSGSDVLDADIRAEAQRIMAPGPHSPRQFRVLDKDAVASGWYRAWTAELLIEPLREQGREILRALVDLEDTGHRGTPVTILTEHPQYPAGQRKLLVCDDGTMVGGLGDVRLEALVKHRGQEVLLGEQGIVEDYHTEDGSTLRLLLEPILPTPMLSVFGGGHIVSPLVRAAALAGFRVRVIDDDPAFVNQERFPDADATIVMAFQHVGEAFDFGQDDYVVLMTRGHAHDHTILEQIYDCPAHYLGMLGSKPRIAKIWQHLAAKGIAQEWLDRVHAPIGLNIHARSPEEIGISILAELIQVRRTSPVVISRRKTQHSYRQPDAPARE